MTPPETEAPHGRSLPVSVQAIALAAGACVLGLLLFGAATLAGSAAAPQDADAPAPAGAFKPTDQQWKGFRIATVDTRMFQPTAVADGKIALDDDLTTPVFSPYSGRVTRVLARAGDTVAAGAPLFAIDASELSQAENDLISAVAGAQTAQAQLELATANEARQHALFLGHGAALKDWQQSRVDLATARGGFASAQIALANVHNRLRILGEPESVMRQLEASKTLLRASASTIVRAPIAGTITQRQVGPGQNIVGSSASAGAALAVFSIGDLSRVWLVANAQETDAPLIHLGDPVAVRVLAYPGRVFSARIAYVAPGIDPVTHRLPVRAEVENPDRALKPEMFASFEITTGAGGRAPAVPAEAVVYEGADAHVWLADPQARTLALRQIDVGRTDHGLVEVVHGLSPGDHVVTSGAVFIDRAISGG